MPASLTAIAQEGKAIFYAVKHNDYRAATGQMHRLKASYRRLAAHLNTSKSTRHLTSRATGQAGAAGRLAASIALLEKTLNARNRFAAMDYANQVILEAANLSANFNRHVPIDAVLLNAYAREVDIWSAKRDMHKLTYVAAMFNRTWHSFRPVVMAHHGQQEATRMDQLATQLKQARSPAAFARLAQPLENNTSRIEQLFSGAGGRSPQRKKSF